MAIIVTEPVETRMRYYLRQVEANEIIALMQMDAKRNFELEELIKERDLYLRECYNFSFGTTAYDEEGKGYVSGTFNVAAEILQTKERYAKRIQRCRVRHKRFNDLLEEIPEEDAETLKIAFCTEIEVDASEVREIIQRHLTIIRKYYPKD